MLLCVDTESMNRIRVQENGFSRTSWRIQIVVLQLIYPYTSAGHAAEEYTRPCYVYYELAVLVSIAAGAAMIAKYTVSALTERYCGLSHYWYMSNPTQSSVER